jgi:hypothetical protein
MIKALGIAAAILLATYFLPNQQPIEIAEAATTPTIPSTSYGLTYYVRTDGGTPAQCDGKTNAAQAGASGTNCAWAHISYALPSGGTARIAGGDRLIIANGSYMVGYGMPGTTGCATAYPYDCKLLPVPSGPSSSQPTRIVGIEYATGCKNKPQLWGTERVFSILDLTNSNNVEVQCLEITDHSHCNGFGSDYTDPSLYCRSTGGYPNGMYADNGIVATNSSSVLLQNLNIHGIAYYGIHAAGLTDWTMNYVRLALNGGAGWGGTYGGYTNMYGTITMTNMVVEWNGCSDNYPYSDTPYACADQNGTGTGDGIELDRTGGNFVITDSVFRYNIQDGLDMLYHTQGGNVTINRVWAEGNIGNQLKIGGAVVLTNSVAIGNCSHIKLKTSIPYTSPSAGLEKCRAGGDTVAVALIDCTGAVGQSCNSGPNVGTTGYIVNNTIVGGGTVLISAGTTFTVTTNPNLYVTNNLMLGDSPNNSQSNSGGDSGAYYDGTGYQIPPTLSVNLTAVNNIINTTKSGNTCLTGASNICNPGTYPSASIVNNIIPANFDPRLKTGSVAINAGTTGTNVPSADYYRVSRPQGAAIDVGAVEKR